MPLRESQPIDFAHFTNEDLAAYLETTAAQHERAAENYDRRIGHPTEYGDWLHSEANLRRVAAARLRALP